jgi:hypothetical protein
VNSNTVIDTSVHADVGPVSIEREGFVTLRLRDGTLISCPRLLTGWTLTALLNVPEVILCRVAPLGAGQFLTISRVVRPDNILHHLSNYSCLLFADHEWFGHIEQAWESVV